MKLKFLFCLLLIISIPLQAQEPVIIEPSGVTTVQSVPPQSESNPAVSNTASESAAPQMNVSSEPAAFSNEAPSSSHTVATDLRVATVGPSTSLPTLNTGEQIDVEVHFEDINGTGSVFSGYADLNFDPAYLQVNSVSYHPDFSYLQGIASPGPGIYEDLGATSSQISAGTNTLVMTVRMTVQQTGTTTISLSPSDNVYAETTIYGSDNDQRTNVDYTSLSLSLGEPTSFISNGTFGSGTSDWIFNGDISYEVNGGVLSFYNTRPFSSMARVFQDIDQAIPSGTQLEVTLDVGNTSIGPKSIEVVLRDALPSPSQYMICAFTMPANTPPTTIALRDITTSNWDGATLLLRSTDFDNRPAVTVDNVSVREYTGGTLNGLDCEGFNVEPNKQLLRNGSVNQFGIKFWDYRGDIEIGHDYVDSNDTSTGYMRFYRTSDPGNQEAAVVYQESQYHIEANMELEAIIRLGNPTNQVRQVRALLRAGGNDEVWPCYFDVPPNTDPTTSIPVRIRGLTGQEWGAMTLVVSDTSTLDQPEIQVGEMVVQYNPNANTNNRCYSNFSTTSTTGDTPAVTDTKPAPPTLPEIHSEQPAPPPQNPADSNGTNQDMEGGMPTIPGF